MAKGKFDYFDAFEQIARAAGDEIDVVIKAAEEFTADCDMKDRLDEAHAIEHKGDNINHSIYQNVAIDFVTPIEREDIIALSQRLDSVVDSAEDIIQCLYVYDVHEMHPQTLEFLRIIKKASDSLTQAVAVFKDYKKYDQHFHYIVEVNTFEEEADRLYLEVIHDLYTAHNDDPIRVMVWTHIFEAMEDCADACEHVADAMNTIILKNA